MLENVWKPRNWSECNPLPRGFASTTIRAHPSRDVYIGTSIHHCISEGRFYIICQISIQEYGLNLAIGVQRSPKLMT